MKRSSRAEARTDQTFLKEVDEAGRQATPRITGCILAQSSEHSHTKALESLQGWCDQILVFDRDREEATATIAQAAAAADGDWLFFLNADECVPPDLGPHLRYLIVECEPEFEALQLPVRHYFCGKWMHHGGRWPGYSRPQLLKKGHFICDTRYPTDIQVKGRTAILSTGDPDLALIHYSFSDLPQYLTQINRDSSIQAERLLEEGASHSWKAQLAHFIHAFQNAYDPSRGEGYRDGMHGFLHAFLVGFSSFASCVKLWDLRRQRNLLVNPAENEPVPSSLKVVLDFMEQVAQDGAEPWIQRGCFNPAPALERVPAEWLAGVSPGGETEALYASYGKQALGTDIASCLVVRNEADILVDALRSVAGWTHPILVVDNASTDNTSEVSRRYTDRIASVTQVRGHLETVRFAVADQVYELGTEEGDGQHRWVLFLDADERVPAQLAEALLKLVAEHGDAFDALFLPFRWYFCGKWIRHCGQWPGYKAAPQLVKQGTYQLNPHVHWGIHLHGRSLYFPADDPELSVRHFSVADVAHYIYKENRATTQEASLRYAAGPVEAGGWDHSWQAQLAHFALEWQDAYETCRGDHDGMHGFALSFLRAMGRFWVRAKLWDLREQRGEAAPDEVVPASIAEALAFLRSVISDGAERWLPRLSLAPALPPRLPQLQDIPASETMTTRTALEVVLQANEQKRQSCPDDAVLLYEAGQLYQSFGRFDEARACLERLVAVVPNVPEECVAEPKDVVALRTYRGWHELALLFHRLGDTAHSAAVLRRVTVTHPGYQAAHRDLTHLESLLRAGEDGQKRDKAVNLVAKRQGAKHLGGHADLTNMDEPVLEYLQNRFAPASFLDLGCGPGGMVEAARQRGLIALGVDGDTTVAPDVLHDFTLGSLPAEAVREIEERLPRPRLVWSVEFVEHVAEAFLPHIAAILTLGDVVFLTHALPGQGGHHHVNEQVPDYWRAVMATIGFQRDVEATSACRGVAANRYTGKTGTVFVRV